MTDESLTLRAEARDVTGKQVKTLRANGKLPVVVYGYELESTPLLVDAKAFRQAYNAAGNTGLISLEIEGKEPVKILIHDIQVDPVRGEHIHADLYAPNLKEEVETEVPLSFVGDAPAVRELEGNLVTNLNELTVRALPTDLPHELEVDLSALKTFDDLIRVADIAVPAGVEIVDEDDVVIALVTEPRSEEELEAELADTSAEAQAAIEELGADKKAEEEGKEASAEDEKSDE